MAPGDLACSQLPRVGGACRPSRPPAARRAPREQTAISMPRALEDKVSQESQVTPACPPGDLALAPPLLPARPPPSSALTPRSQVGNRPSALPAISHICRPLNSGSV